MCNVQDHKRARLYHSISDKAQVGDWRNDDHSKLDSNYVDQTRPNE